MKQVQQVVEAGNPDTEVHERSPGGGPGRRLIAAREARGLPLALVAKNLRLSAATLQALESSRYEDLPEPIYVRGYIRAYARLMEMDEAPLIAEYDRLVDPREPDLKPATRVRREATSPGPHIRGAAALIVVTIAVLLGSWGYSRLNQDIPAQSETASSEGGQPASPASVLTPSQDELPNPDAAPAVALLPEFPAESPAGEEAEENIGVVEPEPPVSEAAAVPLGSESPVAADTEVEVQRRDMLATMAPAVPDLPIAPLASERGRLVRASRAPTGEDVLVIEANDESWAEVVDANGYQLLYYPLHPGVVSSLQGQAPFRVFLGNAPAVDLRLNQERFDHTPFRRENNTARFSVDDAS